MLEFVSKRPVSAESVGLKQAKLVIPACTKGKSNLHPVEKKKKQRGSKCSNPCGEDYGVAEAQVYHFRGNNSIRFSCFKPKWIPLYTDPDD